MKRTLFLTFVLTTYCTSLVAETKPGVKQTGVSAAPVPQQTGVSAPWPMSGLRPSATGVYENNADGRSVIASEYVNLAHDPKHADVVKELFAMMKAGW